MPLKDRKVSIHQLVRIIRRFQQRTVQILERQPKIKYIKVDIKAHLEPKIRPVIAIPNICSVSGTVVNGNGIDI